MLSEPPQLVVKGVPRGIDLCACWAETTITGVSLIRSFVRTLPVTVGPFSSAAVSSIIASARGTQKAHTKQRMAPTHKVTLSGVKRLPCGLDGFLPRKI